MDYRRSDSYYRRGRSPMRGGHYRNSRSRERSYSPQRHGDWRRERRGRSPERYSSSWRVNSPSRRSRSRSYDRSRSRSRGRYSNRRSRSVDSFGRSRRDSSSSGDRRSSSQNVRKQQGEDVHNTMYADREAQNNMDTVAHSYSAQGARGPTNVPGSNSGDFSAIKQGYNNRDMDDEERFLYGDDEEVPRAQPPEKPQNPVQPEAQDSAVTPGGFDSNALKNVLKAIGFDFEMSTQQLQSTMAKPAKKIPAATPSPKKPIVETKQKTPEPPPPQPKPKPKPKPPVSKPIPSSPLGQKIQTIGGCNNPMKPAVVENPSQAQQYFQAYDPYNPTANPPYNPTNIQTAQPVQPILYQNPAPTSLGYPVAIPDPNNPGGTLLVYQPINQPPAPGQPVYHQPEQAAPQNLGHGSRMVLPPQRSNDTSSRPEPETDERQERLNYLQEELEKLKKQQNELMEKKKKGTAQAGIDDGNHIRQAVEEAAGIDSDSSDGSVKGQKEDKSLKYEYLDPGNHWCRLCNTFSPDLMSFLSHLHSKTHRKAIDPYVRPWDDKDRSKKPKTAPLKTKNLKGAEFLIPITGYYCTLCQAFSGDQICADEHLKGHYHNDVYKKHCKKNPSYEKKYKKKKRAALGGSDDKKNGEMQEDSKAKVKVKPEKGEKWVEKVTKSEPTKIDGEPIYSEFKPYASDKKVYHFDMKIKENNKSPQKSTMQGKSQFDSPRSASRPVKNEPKEPTRRRFEETKEPPRRSFEEKKETRSYEEPARHDDPYHRREKEKPRNERPQDHGKRKRGWSPGYDEYDRQQQHDVQHSKRNDHHQETKERPSSRDRGDRRVDKPSEVARKKESFGSQNEAGKKMPGFGKFTWSSGTVRSSRRLEPAPTTLPASHSAFNQDNETGDHKGKIAIKISSKTQYPARLSSFKSGTSKSNPTEATKTAVVDDLKKKVEALKRENALRNQLSSITIPSRSSSRQTRPNTAAVMLGARSIGKHNTLLHSKSKSHKQPEQRDLGDIEADVSPPRPPTEVRVKPPPPREYEPPPPGEEDMDLGVDDDARSDVSGISMEIGSDEG